MSYVAQSIEQAAPVGQELINAAITRHADDPGALFEPDVIAALVQIKNSDPAQWQRTRATLKGLSGLQIGELERLVRISGKGDGDEDRADTQSDVLVALCMEHAELFHDPDSVTYARLKVDGHYEHWEINSRTFKEWLGGIYYRDTGRAAKAAAMADAISALSAAAYHDGECHTVHLRCAQYNGGYILDLADDTWRSVVITSSGWDVVSNSPVRFRRNSNMRALPEPVKDGDLNRLWQNVNIPPNERLLVLGWLLECFRPQTPYPVLELVGEQGSAKSSTHERLRQLVDPNTVNLRAAPKATEDFFVAARSNYLVSYNNLSHLSPERQDALCTLSTGGGFASRKLYTDAEESLFEAKRPVVINGISTNVTASDLLDRTIRIGLPRIKARLSETELEQRWQEDSGQIFGGLLDLFAVTLNALCTVSLENPPRMMDFAILGEAMATALDMPGEFLKAHSQNQHNAILQSIEASPVSMALISMIQSGKRHNGTIKSLLDKLEQYRPEGETAWPKTPRGLGDLIRRNAPPLRTLGLHIEFGERTREGNTVIVCSARDVQGGNTPTQRSHVHTEHAFGERCEHGERLFVPCTSSEENKKSDTATL